MKGVIEQHNYERGENFLKMYHTRMASDMVARLHTTSVGGFDAIRPSTPQQDFIAFLWVEGNHLIRYKKWCHCRKLAPHLLCL